MTTHSPSHRSSAGRVDAGDTWPTAATLPLTWLVGALLLRTALLFAGNLAIAPFVGGYAQALPWANAVIVVVDLITIAVAVALLRRQGRSVAAVIGARWRDTGWALLCFVIVLVGFFAASFVGNLVAYQGPTPMGTGTFQPPLWLGLVSLVVMPITIAFAEELLYRGVGQTELTARLGNVGGLLVMAAFFALQHAALTPLDLQAQVARFVTTFLAGLLFGLLYRWRRTLWPLIVAHWLLDVLGLGLAMLFASLG